jgi:hypothetical protein
MADLRSHLTSLPRLPRLMAFALSISVSAPSLHAQQDLEGNSKLVIRQPPRASTRMHLPNFLPDATKLSTVATNVSDALNQAGYTDQGWFVVPSVWSTGTAPVTETPPSVIGFAVVTRLEQIEDNGQTKAGGARWALDLSPPTVGSFLDAVKLVLKGAPNGRYRVFLIEVSNDPVTQAKTPPGADDWQDFLRKGAKAPFLRVMDSIRVDYGSGGGWYAFVYEYQRSAIGGETQFVSSSKLTAEEHLRASGIWDALSKAGKK